MLPLSRPSGDFLPFESAAALSVPVMQVTPVAAAAPALTASTAPAASNIDLLGDLDILQPSMPPMSMPVQPNSFATATQPNTSAMTAAPISGGGIVGAEPSMAFTPVMLYVSTASTLVPGTALTAAAVESVCMSIGALSVLLAIFIIFAIVLAVYQ